MSASTLLSGFGRGEDGEGKMNTEGHGRGTAMKILTNVAAAIFALMLLHDFIAWAFDRVFWINW